MYVVLLSEMEQWMVQDCDVLIAFGGEKDEFPFRWKREFPFRNRKRVSVPSEERELAFRCSTGEDLLCRAACLRPPQVGVSCHQRGLGSYMSRISPDLLLMHQRQGDQVPFRILFPAISILRPIIDIKRPGRE